ncbi:MAG: hypothetical protein FJ060_09580 [Cyanobacteria bacterium K_Offshore_0m_m2_072]|nr:hypothetical protein [Cyanobacteria bacterium K_Offshore_0m_m2_072]
MKEDLAVGLLDQFVSTGAVALQGEAAVLARRFLRTDRKADDPGVVGVRSDGLNGERHGQDVVVSSNAEAMACGLWVGEASWQSSKQLLASQSLATFLSRSPAPSLQAWVN